MYTPYQQQTAQYGGQYDLLELQHPHPQVQNRSYGSGPGYQPPQPQPGQPQAPGVDQAQSQYGGQNQYQTQQTQHAQQPQQPQQAQFQQQGQTGAFGGAGYGNFFSDPASAMAAQFAKNSFGQSNDYLQQNFGQLIHSTTDVNYYFKVSNSYVIRKIGVILFPYRHKNWSRLTMAPSSQGGPQPQQGVAPGASTGTVYAPPTHDLNAPDLYIPLMSFITYILLWAAFQGFKGDFHPQVFGYLASQTLACSIVDISVFKIGLYLLGCSTQSLFWDIIAFSGYKYVTIITLLVWKNLVSGGWGHILVTLVLTGHLSLFLMRSLKFFVLPSGVDHSSASNSISVGQRRIRIQFLFAYAVIVQFLLILFMGR